MTYLFLLFAIILFADTVLMLNWGIRIGKALQKEPPPVPLAKPAEKAVETVRKAGKRVVGLVKDAKELKAVKKEREERGMFD
jgi:hypothetical protein